jgi:ComEC/Rec2-related protein
MPLPELRPRHPIVGIAIAAVLGIVVADRWTLPLEWLGAGAVCLAAGMLAWPRTVGCWVLTAAVFFALHTVRHHGSAARVLSREFGDGPRVVSARGIVWSEPASVAEWSGRTSGFFDLKVESIEVDGVARSPDALVSVAWIGALPRYGDRVALSGSATNLAPVRNPGQFDFQRYRQRGGVYSQIQVSFAEDCRVESHGHGWRAMALALEARRWIQAELRRDLADAPELASLIESMVLGMGGETPDEVRALFQKTGTLHLFAVSGLNIAMLAAIALHALRPLGLRRGPAVLIVIPLLAAYALVTGLSPSCVRAAIMGAVVLGAQLFDRRAVVCNSLAGAAAGILARDTNQLFLPGFQFSFTLVFIIVWLARRIQRRCERVAQPDPFLPRALWSPATRGGLWCWRCFAAMAGVTLAAWVGSLLFTVGYFHLFSVSAIFANLIAVPLAFAVLLLGLSTVLCAGVWSYGATLCSQANWLMAKSLLTVVQCFSEMPGGHLYLEHPRRDAAPAGEIAVLDCGEGAAIHLRAGERDWLLDTGNAKTCERMVLPYLRSRGVNRLDGLLLTHGDTQHIGGAPTILTELRPRVLLESPLRDRSPIRRGLHAPFEHRAFGRSIVWRGDRLSLSGGAALRVLHPRAGLPGSVADDQALVARLECAGTRILFMSDSGFATEQWLAENEPDLRSDVVVKGWHSQDLSGTSDFLARVQPQAVICSAREYGDSGEALAAWTRDLTARGITVFRQDECGAVQIEIRDGATLLRAVANGRVLRIGRR